MAYTPYRPIDSKTDHEQFRDHDLPEVASNPDDKEAKELYRPDHMSPEVSYPPAAPEPIAGRDDVAAYYAPQTPDPERAARGDQPNTICGIRRKIFFIILAIVILVVVIGVALGAGLGIGLSKKKSSDTTAPQSAGDSNPNAVPLSVLNNTGITSTMRGDNAGMLVYYQSDNGTVIEEYHDKANLTTSKLVSPVPASQQIINPGNFGQQSPMSAISYTYKGALWKHLFYVDNSGFVRLANNSGKTPDQWTQGGVLSQVPVKSGSMGLTSCYSDDKGNDLHVLFGNSNGAITEYFYSFNSTGWKRGSTMASGTSMSGAACGVYRQGNTKRLILYMRNATSNALVHQVRNVDPVDSWIFVTESNVVKDSSMQIASDTGMALASNADNSIIYLFYRGKDGKMKQLNLPAQANNPVTTYNSWDTVIPAGTQIAATWPDSSTEGPLVLYQSKTDQIQSSIVNWNAVILANATLEADYQ